MYSTPFLYREANLSKLDYQLDDVFSVRVKDQLFLFGARDLPRDFSLYPLLASVEAYETPKSAPPLRQACCWV
jgi:hypothetical protein